jgi:hypothetical protein
MPQASLSMVSMNVPITQASLAFAPPMQPAQHQGFSAVQPAQAPRPVPAAPSPGGEPVPPRMSGSSHPLTIPSPMEPVQSIPASPQQPPMGGTLATSVPHANPDPLPSLDALPPMPMTPTRARPSYESYGSEFLPLTPLRPLPFSPASFHPSPRPGPESGLQPSVHDPWSPQPANGLAFHPGIQAPLVLFAAPASPQSNAF